jgi:hypothetical protein
MRRRTVILDTTAEIAPAPEPPQASSSYLVRRLAPAGLTFKPPQLAGYAPLLGPLLTSDAYGEVLTEHVVKKECRVPLPAWVKEPGELPALGQEISPEALTTSKAESVLAPGPQDGPSILTRYQTGLLTMANWGAFKPKAFLEDLDVFLEGP